MGVSLVARFTDKSREMEIAGAKLESHFLKGPHGRRRRGRFPDLRFQFSTGETKPALGTVARWSRRTSSRELKPYNSVAIRMPEGHRQDPLRRETADVLTKSRPEPRCQSRVAPTSKLPEETVRTADSPAIKT